MPSTRRKAAYAAICLLSASSYAQRIVALPPIRRDARGVVDRRAAQTYEGCYSSSDGLTDQGAYQYQTQSYCQGICLPAGSAVLGLSAGSDCWCGDVLPPVDSKVDDSKCDTPCFGFGNDNCGGAGYYSVYLTGLEADVANSGDSSSSSTSSTSSSSSTLPTSSTLSTPTPTTTATAASSTSTSSPATIITSVAPTTVVVTQSPASQVDPTSSPTPTSNSDGGGSKTNVAGIAAGVVVGVIAAAAAIAGLIFFLRHKRKQQEETEEYRRTQVSNFMHGTHGGEPKPPNTGYSQRSDARLDPEAGARRNSSGSIADDQDYSRKILRVANPDRN